MQNSEVMRDLSRASDMNTLVADSVVAGYGSRRSSMASPLSRKPVRITCIFGAQWLRQVDLAESDRRRAAGMGRRNRAWRRNDQQFAGP